MSIGSFSIYFCIYLKMEGAVCKENPEDAKLPVPEPSDIERASSTNFDDLEIELKKLKTDLNGRKKLFMLNLNCKFTLYLK